MPFFSTNLATVIILTGSPLPKEMERNAYLDKSSPIGNLIILPSGQPKAIA